MICWHYCTNDSFSRIVGNKTLRLSDLSLSNDGREGREVVATIEELRSELSDSPLLKILTPELLGQFPNDAKGLGFCLSTDGDDLGQWREYANNGLGLSIGFSQSKLTDLARRAENPGRRLMFGKVRYDREQKKEEVRNFFNNPEIMQGGHESATDRWLEFYLERQYIWKHHSFTSEAEWRLIAGYENNPRRVPLSNVQFDGKESALVPYYDHSIEGHLTGLIESVVLGNNNRTDPRTLKAWLTDNHFGEVTVSKSDVSIQL